MQYSLLLTIDSPKGKLPKNIPIQFRYHG